MVYGSMMHRTFSPLFTVTVTDALPHLPSPSMPLKSESQRHNYHLLLPLKSETPFPSTSLPLKSEASGVTVFRDTSLISETPGVSKFRKLLITLLTQEI